MTQEEKARAYDEALEDMRVIYPNLKGDAKLAVEHAFPQLAESEDERIRKYFIWIVKNVIDNIQGLKLSEEQTIELIDNYSGIKESDMIAWLEKQKEKMTAEEYESSELFQLKLKTKYANGYQDGLVQKEQKPAERSEDGSGGFVA